MFVKLMTALFGWRQDTITPLDVGRRLHDALTDSRLVVLAGVRRVPQEEATDQTTAHLLAFLAR